MNIDQTRLEQAIEEFQSAKVPHKRAAAYRRILLHGSRLNRWTKDTAGLLHRQLAWLDANEGKPTAGQRFTEWEALLRRYEGACDLLTVAEQSLGTPIQVKAAA